MSSSRLKFTVSVKDLKETLGRISQIPGAKSVIPMVRITSAMDGLSLTRITPEATMRATTKDSDIEGEGEVEVGFTSFDKLIGRCRGVTVTVEERGDKLFLKSAAAEMNLLKTPPGTMPEPAEPDMECEVVNMPVEELLNYLGIVAGAASTDAADVALLGVCARSMFGRLHFFATNRKAMHCVSTPHETQVDTLIPNDVVASIKAAFSGMEAVASLSFHSNGIRVLTERVELFASVSEGKPPNMEAFLNAVYAAPVIRSTTVDRETLKEALRSVAPVAAGELRAVDMTFQRGQLVIEATNNQDSDITERVDALVTGEGSVRFGAGYMADVLANATGEEVTINNVLQALYIRQDDRVFTVGIMVKQQSQ